MLLFLLYSSKNKDKSALLHAIEIKSTPIILLLLSFKVVVLTNDSLLFFSSTKISCVFFFIKLYLYCNATVV